VPVPVPVPTGLSSPQLTRSDARVAAAASARHAPPHAKALPRTGVRCPLVSAISHLALACRPFLRTGTAWSTDPDCPGVQAVEYRLLDCFLLPVVLTLVLGRRYVSIGSRSRRLVYENPRSRVANSTTCSDRALRVGAGRSEVGARASVLAPPAATPEPSRDPRRVRFVRERGHGQSKRALGGARREVAVYRMRSGPGTRRADTRSSTGTRGTGCHPIPVARRHAAAGRRVWAPRLTALPSVPTSPRRNGRSAR
jgi:hypothetical protein